MSNSGAPATPPMITEEWHRRILEEKMRREADQVWELQESAEVFPGVSKHTQRRTLAQDWVDGSITDPRAALDIVDALGIWPRADEDDYGWWRDWVQFFQTEASILDAQERPTAAKQTSPLPAYPKTQAGIQGAAMAAYERHAHGGGGR